MMMVQDVANFNSIKVQLKHVTTSDDASLNEFQFHKGTIKTNVEIGKDIQGVNFNSIKVQLKPSLRLRKTRRYRISIP